MERSESQKEANRIAAKAYYHRNKLKILKKRREKDMKAESDGGKRIAVRIKTIQTYGLYDLAEEHEYPTEEPDDTNAVPYLDRDVVVTEEFLKLREKIENKLSEYDVAISRMVDTKFKDAENVYQGKLRIVDTKKLTWTALENYINQIPSSRDNKEFGISIQTKRAYIGKYNAMKRYDMFGSKCNPDKDVVACFNDLNVIDRIKSHGPTEYEYTDSKGVRRKGTGTYKDIGGFFTLPISLHNRIPEFKSRFDKSTNKNAFEAYKTASDVYKLYKMKTDEAKKKDEPAQNWKIFEDARELLAEELQEHESGVAVLGNNKTKKFRSAPFTKSKYLGLSHNEKKLKHPHTLRTYLETWRFYVIMCLYPRGILHTFLC